MDPVGGKPSAGTAPRLITTADLDRLLEEAKKPFLSAPASGVIAKATRDFVAHVGSAGANDVRQIAAAQVKLLEGYYQEVLAQSRKSFFWALIGSGISLVLFLGAVGLSVWNGLSPASVVPFLSGAAFEAVSAFVFYLYGKTSSQLSAFHSRLEVLQRYLLANSVCDSLSTPEERDKARAALIAEISRAQPLPQQQ